MYKKIFAIFVLGAILCACGDNKSPATQDSAPNQNNIEILNVSYDVSRDFYKQYNPLFVEYYQNLHPDTKITIKQSHGGSSKQAQSIQQGLQADVATMNQGSDIELLAKSKLVADNWENQFANHAVPFTSTVVFLVRENNPKNIQDWRDLTHSDTQIVIANPKTTGNGRYAFLGAYGYGLHTFNNDKTQTHNFVKGVLDNVVIFENGGRAATTTFAQRDIGDVLITFENEAHTILDKFADKKLQIIYPSYTVAAENPVAVVQAVTDKKGTTDIAKAYLEYLWSEPAQTLATNLHFRPSDTQILAEHADKFPQLTTFRPTDVLGSWSVIMQEYFADGGVYDTLVLGNNKAATNP